MKAKIRITPKAGVLDPQGKAIANALGQLGFDDTEDRQGLSQEDAWARWVMETARKWEDIDDLIHHTGIEAVDADHRRMTEVALQISNLLDMLQRTCNGRLTANEVLGHEEYVLTKLYESA